MSFPESVCFQDTLDGETVIKNTSECAGIFKVRARANELGEVVSRELELEPGERRRIPISFDSFPSSPVSLKETVEVKKSDGSFEALDERNIDIEPKFANLQVVSAPYPSHVQPGDPITANVTVQNAGECDGRASLSGVNLPNREFTLAPGDSEIIQHSLQMPGGAQEISLSLKNLKKDEVADTFTSKVEPAQTVIIDKSEGKIEMIGGFNTKTPYTAIVQGSNITGAGDLEPEDKSVGPSKLKQFSGTVSTSPSDTDTIEFSSLRYLSMSFDKNIQWVLEGDIQGEASSFKYSEYPLGAVNRFLPTTVDEHDITVSAGLTDRVQDIKRRVGVKSRIISNPVTRRVSK